MEKRVASIAALLLFLVAGLFAAAVAGDDADGAIRLPSDTTASEMARIVRGTTTTEGENGEKRPWKCCDKSVTGPTTEGKVVWYCMDKVKKCTCNSCYELVASQSYYCLDGYSGISPGPSCTTHA
nr:unnamed protein product [Digitaria exilis]